MKFSTTTAVLKAAAFFGAMDAYRQASEDVGIAKAGLTPAEVPSFAVTAAQKNQRRLLVKNAGPIVQMFIGDAIGDAWGFGVDMEDTYWLRQHLNFTENKWPFRRYVPQEWAGDWDPKLTGMYSDDAEMTVGLAKGFMKYGKNIDKDQMLEAWKAEWDLSKERPESTNAGHDYGDGKRRSGHGSIRYYWTGRKTIEEVRQSQADKDYPGNAPPMRSLPLMFFSAAERERLATANADATHPHPKARAASFAMASGARYLWEKKGAKSMIISQVLKELRASSLKDDETEEYLQKVDTLPDWHTYGDKMKEMPTAVLNLLVGPQPRKYVAPSDQDKQGYVSCGLDSDSMRTVGVVLYALKFHKGAWDGLTPAIYIGGDIDSTAALVVGAIGASEGLKIGEPGGIPFWVIEQLEGVEYLVAQGKLFDAWLKKEKLMG